MGVDWGKIKLRPGDWCCPEHGVIRRPHQGVVPACPDCLRSLTVIVEKRGHLVDVEPAPDECANGHPHRANSYLVGWTGCRCNAMGGHRTWTCRTKGCGSVQTWPPHDVTADMPYAGPGHGDEWRAGT